MVLGYCRLCDKLIPIRPGQQKPGSRERWWYPIEHENQDGTRCEGTKRGI